MSSTDPFQCFGDDGSTSSSNDGDESDRCDLRVRLGRAVPIVSVTTSKEDTGAEHKALSPALPRRDPSCGVCAFHPHTELSLLTHVRNSLSSPSSSLTARTPADGCCGDNVDDGVSPAVRRATEVLDAADEYCATRHWMMHVGPEKGKIAAAALRAAVEGKLAASDDDGGGAAVPFVAVELGTYCGYASVSLGRELLLLGERRESDGALTQRLSCRLFTTEIHPEYASVAEEMIRLAGLEGMVSLHCVAYDGFETDVVSVVCDAVRSWKKDLAKDLPLTKGGATDNEDDELTIDFLFVDHDKDAYLTDLRRFESAGMIRRGAKVVADNVVFARIDDYVAYVRQKAEEGIVRTETVSCSVEYSGGGGGDNGDDSEANVRDGIEITDYLRDPRS